MIEVIRSIKNDYEKRKYLMKIYRERKDIFYNLVLNNILELLPIIYTPTISNAVIEFSNENKNNKKLNIISIKDEDNLDLLLDKMINKRDIKIVILTDGEAILGIGDWGVNGLEISLGKKIVYSLATDIKDDEILELAIDVGTNNTKLLNDNNYLGLKINRINDEKYYEFMHRLISKIIEKTNNALIHFEDFGKYRANELLEKYRNKILCFNDDIQGTASIVLAGILKGLEIKKEKLSEQKYLCFGAGTAGMGIVNLVFEKMLLSGMSKKEAKNSIFLFDKEGLLFEDNLKLTKNQRKFARSILDKKDLQDSKNLKEVIKKFKINILVGTSGKYNKFDEDILNELRNNSSKAMIFALSNPLTLCELSLDNIEKYKNEFIISTGTNVSDIAWCNNAMIYPAIVNIALNMNLKHIDDKFLILCVNIFSSLNSLEDKIYPEIKELKDYTKRLINEVSNNINK